jgi:hypothetical protein
VFDVVLLKSYKFDGVVVYTFCLCLQTGCMYFLKASVIQKELRVSEKDNFVGVTVNLKFPYDHFQVSFH